MPYPVKNLLEGKGKPVTISPREPVTDALDLMTEHDFSQLPVVETADLPLGMITHESILSAACSFGVSVEKLRVSNAIVRARTFQPEDDLFDLLSALGEAYAVLIVDGSGRLAGIVTSYDSTEYFRARAEDMMLIEDIETMIKDLILVAFTDLERSVDEEMLAAAIEEITNSGSDLKKRYKRALQHYLQLKYGSSAVDEEWFDKTFEHLGPGGKATPFDRLTLHVYVQLLLHGSRWDLYRDFFDPEAEPLHVMLDGVREVRNELAHFRGEPSAARRGRLRFCAEWLARHPAEDLLAERKGIPVDWPAGTIKAGEGAAIIRETGEAYECAGNEGDEIAPIEEVSSPSDSRYAPLGRWLQSHEADRIRLTFEQIERILGSELPKSARSHRSWWSNDAADLAPRHAVALRLPGAPQVGNAPGRSAYLSVA